MGGFGGWVGFGRGRVVGVLGRGGVCAGWECVRGWGLNHPADRSQRSDHRGVRCAAAAYNVVTFTAVADDIDRGDKYFATVTHNIDASLGNYASVDVDPVTVTTTDDDTRGVRLSQTSLEFREGATDSSVTLHEGRVPLVIGLASWRSVREGRPVKTKEITP